MELLKCLYKHNKNPIPWHLSAACVWPVARIGLNEWHVDLVYLLINGYGLTCGRDLDGGLTYIWI